MINLLINGALNFDASTFCNETADVLGFVGWILTIFKIAIPLVIIAFGMFDLGKAVVASKDDEIKTQTKKLMNRALAGVFIFLVPSLIMWLFGAVLSTDEQAQSDAFQKCQDCVLKPWSCK